MRDVLSLFTTEQTARLSKLSPRQLAYWDTTDFFKPYSHHDEGVFRRAYSLRDVIELRTLSLLRNRVPLTQLRQVKDVLRGYEDAWSALNFWVAGRTVYWEDPANQVRESVRPKRQTVIPIEMAKIEREVRHDVRRLSVERSTEDVGRITQDRYVKHNEPVVSGTRVPVAAILDFHRAGYSVEEIIAEYPRLKTEDVAAAIEWESQQKAS